MKTEEQEHTKTVCNLVVLEGLTDPAPNVPLVALCLFDCYGF